MVTDNLCSDVQNIKVLIDELFSLFKTCRKFNFTFADIDVLKQEKRIWAHVFKKYNIDSRDKIHWAIEKFMEERPLYPPTSEQFLKWNIPEQKTKEGIPGVEYAYKEACKMSHPSETEKEFTHIVVEYAWRETGSLKLRTSTKSNEKDIKRLFEYNYAAACRIFISEGESGLRTQKITKALDNNKQHKTAKSKSTWNTGQLLQEYAHVKNPKQMREALKEKQGIGELL